MKEENKKTVKKGILAAAGTAAGAAVGTVIENAVGSAAAGNQASPESEVIEAVEVAVVEETAAEVREEVETVYAAAPVELAEVTVTGHAAGHAHHSPAASAAVHPTEDAEEPIMAEVISSPAVSTTPVAEEDHYDDIVVVSEGTDVHDDLFTVQLNVKPDIPDLFPSSLPTASAAAESTETPNYITEEDFAMKDDGVGTDAPAGDALDMPDYINNANINSFIDSI